MCTSSSPLNRLSTAKWLIGALLSLLFISAAQAQTTWAIDPLNPVAPRVANPYPRQTAGTIPGVPAPGTPLDCTQAGLVLKDAMQQAIALNGAGGQVTILLYTQNFASDFEYCATRPINFPPEPADPTGNETGFPVVRANPNIDIAVRRGVGVTGTVFVQRQPEAGFEDVPYRLFAVEGQSRLTLSELTLRRGIAGEGGAVRVVLSNATSTTQGLVAETCVFTQNTALRRGGAVSNIVQSLADPTQNALPVTFRDCLFQANTARVQGGGVLGGGGVYVERSAATFVGCRFLQNTCDDPNSPGIELAGFGGGLYMNRGGDVGNLLPVQMIPSFNPNGTIRNPMLFDQNVAGSGGGAYINGGTTQISPVENSPIAADFTRNSAVADGGGAYVLASLVTIQGSNFGFAGLGNRATNGGGLFSSTSNLRVIRSRFTENRAQSGFLPVNPPPVGGSLTGNGGGANADAKGVPVAFEECCFTDNFAQVIGGGALVRGNGVPFIDDCVFSRNQAQQGGGLGIGDGVSNNTNAFVYNTVLTHNIGTLEGGGVWVASSSPQFLHCTIAANRAVPFAGGTPSSANAGTGIHMTRIAPQIEVLNSIIWDNARGGIRNAGNSAFTTNVFGSLSRSNLIGPPQVESQAIRVRHTIVQTNNNNDNSIPYPPQADAPGSNLNLNPRFVFLDGGSATSPTGNVHLTCPSPAIDRASFQRARELITRVANGANNPIPVFTDEVLGDPVQFETVLLEFIDDYDDGSTTTNTIPAPALQTPGQFPPIPLVDENCPAPNCTTPYALGEPIQPRTCRATQCQSDMGADESLTEFTVPPIADRVVCLGGSQSFDATANCPTSSACDPATNGPAFLFQWCRVDRDVNGICTEVAINNPFVAGNPTIPGYTVTNVTATTSRLNVSSALARDNTLFRVKVYRGGPGLFVPLSTPINIGGVNYLGEACDPLSCPGADQYARLWVIEPPTVIALPPNPDIVCRAGNQCLEYDINYAVLPSGPQVFECRDALGAVVFSFTSTPPVACTPAVTFTKATMPGGAQTPLAPADPRIQSDAPGAPVNGRITQRWRLCFSNAMDSDCGRYTLSVNCSNLGAGKCTPGSAFADLCVTPPPTASAGGPYTVCVGGAQTLTFTATFPASSCVFCPSQPCTAGAIITKNGTPLPPAAYVCDPINASRQINCRVVIASATEADCGQYCIQPVCTNLEAGKCNYPTACATLCVLPQITITGDATKTVCRNGSQTFTFTGTFPVGTCQFCTTGLCTPSMTIRKNGTLITTGVTCDPFNATSRQLVCRVNIPSATTADCAEYCAEARCSNLDPAKCFARFCTQLCVLDPIVATAERPTAAVCEGGRQTLNFSATFPVGTCQYCTTASCLPTAVLRRNGVDLPPASYVCDPINAQRQINCRVTIDPASQADCGEYCIEARCSNLESNKCFARACTQLCVLPPPTIVGTPEFTVCLGGMQTINWTATFPVGPCANCSTTTCTRSLVVKKNGVALPPTSYVCDPINAQRQVNCRLTVNSATCTDAAEYCLEATCSNLGDGKCLVASYCTRLCVIEWIVTGSDQKVCVGGDQCIDLLATFRACNPAFCPTELPCTPSVTITRNGSTLPASAYTETSPTPTSRLYSICINDATTAAAGEYCASLTCGNLAGSKCPPVRGCARLCVIPPPQVGGDSPACVCIGGDQTLNFFAVFPLPSGGTAQYCPLGLPDCIPAVRLTLNGSELTAGSFVCDPINAQRRINCRVPIVGADAGDGGQYCIEAYYANITSAKCPPVSYCTELSVYDPPTVMADDAPKVCIGQDACADITFSAPPCCTANLTFRRVGGGTVTLGGRFQLVTVGANQRQFKIRQATLADSGEYEVCISCTNLATNKCRTVCDTFRIDILPPPTITAPPPVTACVGVDQVCLTFPYTHSPLCPGIFTLRKNGSVICLNVPEFDDPNTGPNEAVCVNGRVTLRPGASPNTREVCITNVEEGDEGTYQLCITYANLSPVGVCEACAEVQLDTRTLMVSIPDVSLCPDETTDLCVDIMGCGPCSPATYIIQWYKNDVLIPDQDGCCITITSPLVLGTPDTYRVVVTPRNPATCPCNPEEDEATVTLLPPEQCCWCVPCPLVCWDNGRYDDNDGALSAVPVHGEFPELKVAADFALCEGQLHKLNKFAGTMLIRQDTALPYKAKLTLYEDCDGCPGAMIDMFDFTYIENICRVGLPDADGIQQVVFEFNLSSKKIWLRGGVTYWWSLQGVSPTPDPNYEAFWATSMQGNIIGSVPKKMQVGVDEGWLPLDECCIDCTEMSFCLECESCKIIHDNGVPGPVALASGTRSEKSTSPSRNSRAADQIVIAPCKDWMACVVEGYIYTNCINFHSYLEVYENLCDAPAFELTGTPYFRWRAEKIEDLLYTVQIDGLTLNAYKVTFCPMATDQYPMGLLLRSNRNYWLSVSVEDTFAQNQRAYFAHNDTVCDPCPIKFVPGQEIAPGRGVFRWTTVNRDFAFLIAAKMLSPDQVPPPVAPLPACPADVNGDGTVSMQDLFDFTAAWMVGCP